MPVVDTLVTKFVYDASGTRKGEADVLGATNRIGKGIASSVATASKAALGFAAVAGTGLLAFGKKALDGAVSFDTLTRSLTAVTKSGQRAKSILDFTDVLAGPSVFGADQLAAAALQLEAFKLNTERFLPVVEKLGTVFGGTTESLDQFTRALGYIRGGRFGEGIESLAAAGIGRDDLTAKGLKFDKGGAYLGDYKALLDAVEQLVQERFGRLSKEMADGPAAALASIGDTSRIAMRQVGQSLLKEAVPGVKELNRELSSIVQSGAIKEITAGFVGMVSGQDIGRYLGQGLRQFVSLLREAPGWIEKNKDTFKQLGSSVASIFRTLSTTGLPVLNAITGTVDRMLKIFNGLPAGVQSVLVTLAAVNKVGGGVVGSTLGALGKVNVGDGAGGTSSLGGLLMKTITSPLGLVGSVLIAGAVGLADAASKGIKVLEGRREDRENIPKYKTEDPVDPVTGKPLVDARGNRLRGRQVHDKNGNRVELTEEEKEAVYKANRKRRALLDLGLEPEEFNPTQTPTPNGPDKPTPATSPVMNALERIAIATEKTANQLEDASSGGGSNVAAAIAALQLNSLNGGRVPQKLRFLGV